MPFQGFSNNQQQQPLFPQPPAGTSWLNQQQQVPQQNENIDFETLHEDQPNIQQVNQPVYEEHKLNDPVPEQQQHQEQAQQQQQPNINDLINKQVNEVLNNQNYLKEFVNPKVYNELSENRDINNYITKKYYMLNDDNDFNNNSFTKKNVNSLDEKYINTSEAANNYFKLGVYLLDKYQYNTIFKFNENPESFINNVEQDNYNKKLYKLAELSFKRYINEHEEEKDIYTEKINKIALLMKAINEKIYSNQYIESNYNNFKLKRRI